MAKGYTVLGIDELTRVNDDRQLETYYRIRAKTDGGARFTVDVGADQSTPDKAGPVLEARAKEIDGILDL